MKFGGVHVRLGSLSGDAVEVAAMRGKEGLSRLYRFDIDVVTEVDLLSLDPTLLGNSATLTWTTEGDMIVPTQGIVSAVSATGFDQRGKHHFSVRLSPRMALLEQRKTSRIFQNRSVVDIVSAVLDVHGISKVWCLAKKYPVRGYCVQYQETDWAFVTRICAEVGIFFYFVHPSLRDIDAGASLDSDTESVVFADDVRHYPPMTTPGVEFAAGEAATDVAAPALSFRPAGGAIEGGEHIEEFAYRRAVRPQSIALRDYDFLRPRLDIDASMHVGSETNDAKDKPLAARPAATTGPLEVYEHHGEYGETEVSQDQARVLLDGCRARAIVVKGKGSCRRFLAGRRFRLEGYPHDELEGREFAIVQVVHSYTSAQAAGGRDAYSNRFECVPASVPYRPKKKPRSLSQVLETADVVGPSGETIYTDSLGRIKVQFHWDRDGLKNDQSSCFMRVSQPWAGTSWGVQFIPRIGDEVLVSFIGGDEDRPVVIGSVYNATHPPPFPLPLGKTQSGIRTQSVGGTGQNELAFEDGAGAEVLSVKAARDLREVAGNDHDIDVSGEQTTRIRKSQIITVDGERSVSVGGDDTRSIAGASLTNIGSDQRISVDGSRMQRITGQDTSHTHGTTVHDSGNHTVTIEGASTTTVGTNDEPSALAVLVYGSASHEATETFTLRSDQRILLTAGESSISLTPGAVRIDAKTIVVRAKEKLVLLGDGPGIELGKDAEVLADAIRMFSKGGSVELDADAAHVDGPLVKLNCGAGDEPEIEDDVDKPTMKVFRWRCLDENLKPYKGKTYRLITQGFRCRGTTDEDGMVEKDIPIDAVSAELVLWKQSFPEGERLTYAIRLGDLPPATGAYGALLRLRNLGYYLGPDSDDVSPELAAALMEFQADHGLTANGEIDAGTADKLEEVHP